MSLPNDTGIFNKDFTLLFIINFASHAGLQMFASVMSTPIRCSGWSYPLMLS